jgi:copper oxidase (laccase) domain-containing protein
MMAELHGTQAGDVAALLGPCICGDCYKVDAARVAEFEEQISGYLPVQYVQSEELAAVSGTPVRRSDSGQYSLDLQAANTHLLAANGVRNITVCRACTCEDQRLGSYRREGAAYSRNLALMNTVHLPTM